MGKSILARRTRRYYILSGNVLYYFASKEDTSVRGVIFLTGSLVETARDAALETQGYHGLEILHKDMCSDEHEHHLHESRILYSDTAEDRDQWVRALQHAAEVVPIEDDYDIGKELGHGRFSTVCECVHRVSQQRHAVKIIPKTQMTLEEKQLLRTEIAVLKLVNHPNIIRMIGEFSLSLSLFISSSLFLSFYLSLSLSHTHTHAKSPYTSLLHPQVSTKTERRYASFWSCSRAVNSSSVSSAVRDLQMPRRHAF